MPVIVSLTCAFTGVIAVTIAPEQPCHACCRRIRIPARRNPSRIRRPGDPIFCPFAAHLLVRAEARGRVAAGGDGGR